VTDLSNMPLGGIRVIDFTQVMMGPVATQMLADYGADVIKIEKPGTGDLSRTSFPNDPAGLLGPVYCSLNRNKRSVVLDMRKQEDKALVLQLLQTLQRVRAVECCNPLAVLLLRNIAAVGEDPGDAIAPVLAAEVEAGEALDVERVLGVDRCNVLVELGQRGGRGGDAGLGPDILAVEHVARSEVVRQRVVLPVDLAGRHEGRQQLGAAERLVLAGDVEERADVGERGRLRVAHFRDVRRVVLVRQRRRELGHNV